MGNNFKKVKSIFHIVLLTVRALYGSFMDKSGKHPHMVLQIIFWGLLLNYKCILCDKKREFPLFFQFVNTTSGGFMIIMALICAGIFVSEELNRKTQLAVTYVAAIFHALSILSLLGEYVENTREGRMLAAVVFCCLLAVLYFVEAIYISVKKKVIMEDA